MKLNTNSRYVYDCMATYLVNLRSTLPDELSVIFFTNSGSEATDLALKLARTHTNSKHTITLEQ
jgi:ethanolamine-phosphate phospho-lyase